MPPKRRRKHPYLNYLTPHPSLSEIIEPGQSSEDPIRVVDNEEGDSNDGVTGCVYGCLDSTDFGHIAHYYAEDQLLQSPYTSTHDSVSLFSEPYDPMLGQSSCKVVIVPTAGFYKAGDVDPKTWLPCWIIVTSAAETGTPFIPIISTRFDKLEKPTNRVVTTSSGVEGNKLPVWEPGSGILVMENPYIVPRAWLHRIRPKTWVNLTEVSKRDLRRVFKNRHLVATGEPFEGSHVVEQPQAGADSMTVDSNTSHSPD